MNLESAFAECEAVVRRVDADRYFSALFGPAEKRSLLFALYAFNYELARIGEVAHEPMMGEIRLQWWREAVESARAGKPRSHYVAHALSEVFTRTDLSLALFESLIDARAFDVSKETFADDSACDAYLDTTSGNLMRLAGRVLGAGDAHDNFAREAGIAYGLAGLIRSEAVHRARGKHFIRDAGVAAAEAMRRFSSARTLPKAGGALPAFLPAALVPLYLKQPGRHLPIYRKQLAFLSASLRGRL